MSHVKKPSKQRQILFFLIGAMGFMGVFILGLWLTLGFPAAARWLVQGMLILAYIYGYTFRLGYILGIIPKEKMGILETSVVSHPLSYYLFKGISLMWLSLIILFFVIVVGGTYLTTR